VVASIVHLGHALGLTVVAEGVETQEQLDLARELGCDLAQGFLFARPAPPEKIDQLLFEGSARVTGRREAAA